MSKKVKIILAVLLVAIIIISNKYTIRIVVTSSMEPVIKTNSIVIIKKCDIDDIQENDIILFNSYDNIIHRVINIKEKGNNKVLYTKGDANKHMDKEAVNREMLVGKVVKTINSVSWLITKYYELLEGV